MKRCSRGLALAILIVAAAFIVPITDACAEQQGRGVPILLYHRFGPVVADSMTITTAVFEDQLAWLRAHDYQIIPLRTLVESLGNHQITVAPHSVVITADDGHKSVYTDMFPLIVRYHIPITLFIYPSAISNASYAMTWAQLAEMSHSGLVDIQSHTYWHPNFNHERARLSPDAYRAFVMSQFTRSKQVLERQFGSEVDLLAWPFGIHDDQLDQWATEAGYKAALTLQRAPASRASRLLALPRYLMTDADGGPRFAAIIEGSGAHGGTP